MKTRLLHSYEKCQIDNYDYALPLMRDDQIMIKTILCGICRSDIGSWNRWEDMPYGGKIGFFGHEGLGEVVVVGKDISSSVKPGQLVSTWSDPAYADYYYATKDEFTIVPEVDPKYILQPSACAVNIGFETMRFANFLFSNEQPKILLLGSGFMSVVLAQYFRFGRIEVDIVGNSNKDIWNRLGFNLISDFPEGEERYHAVIDLTSKAENYEKIVRITKKEGLVCYASTPYTPVKTNFFEACWKCLTFIMPSPRNTQFPGMMKMTANLIENGTIDMTGLWTRGYNREDIEEVRKGFADGTNRTPDYVRGYIDWRKKS